MKNNSIYDDVIKLKGDKLKNKDIADKLGVSLNAVEKTLQLNRLHVKFKSILNNEQYNKLLNLNFKALDIRLIQDDNDSVRSLLDSIDFKITAKELKEKIELIKVKQEQVEVIKRDIENINKHVGKIRDDLKNLEKEYNDVVNEIDDKFKFIEKDTELSDDKKSQLLKCVAYDKGLNKYVFVGFINSNKYFYLKNKNLIHYDENLNAYWGYLPPPIIPDIDRFIQYVKKSRGFTAEFQIKYTKNKNLIWANRKDKELRQLIDIKDKLKIKRKELKEYNKQLKTVVDSDLNDFMTVLEAKNELSQKNILKHNELCVQGMKWLKSQGYISDIEYSHNNFRFDVIGANLKENKIIILEAKVSLNDYKQDKKKENYIQYCNELYVITNNYSVRVEEERNIHGAMGIIYINDYDNSIEIIKNATVNNNVNLDIDDVIKKIYNKFWNKIYKI